MLLRLFIIELENFVLPASLWKNMQKKIGMFRKCRLVYKSRAVRQAFEGSPFFCVDNILFFASLFLQQVTDFCK